MIGLTGRVLVITQLPTDIKLCIADVGDIGRKGPYAHYYVQIYPGNNSFVGKLNQ